MADPGQLLQTVGELFVVLGRLVVEILQLGWKMSLVIGWIAWWLCGVNWSRVWPVLAQGAWVPVILIGVLAALVASKIVPCSHIYYFDSIRMPNTFLSQLGGVGLLAGSALLCGWLQGVLGWAPAEAEPEPATHAGHDH